MTQVIDVMIKMWKSAGIIHADFSEFNILYFQRQIWVWFFLYFSNHEYLRYVIREKWK